MANYSADIRLGIVGKDKLNRVEQQLKRISKLQTTISKKTQLTIDSQPALNQIKKVETRLGKLQKTVKVTVQESRTRPRATSTASPVEASSSGQSLAAAASLVGSGRVVGSTEKLASAMSKVVAQTEALVRADIRQNQLQDELLSAADQKWKAEKEFLDYKNQVLKKQNEINDAYRQGVKIGKQSPLQAANSLQSMAPKLQRLNQELQEAEAAYSKVEQAQRESTKEVVRLSKEQDALTNSSNRSSRALSGFGQAAVAVGSALAAIGIGRFVVDAFRVATTIESQEVRLKALADGYDDFSNVQAAAARGQKLFNQTQQEANDQFSRAYARLRPLGLTLEQVQAVYEGFNVAARLSGTTTAEAAGAFTQLTQALGSGVLRGEELNSVLEQSPALAKAIATELGTTIGQLKQFGKDGAISSETVLKALVRVRKEGVNRLSAVMDTPAQKFKELEIAGEQFKIALADEALPAVTQAVGTLAQMIAALAGPIRGIGQLANQTLGSVLDLIDAATKPKAAAAANAIRNGRLPLAGLGGVTGARELFEGTGPQGRGLEGLYEESKELAKLRNQPRTTVLLELMQNRLKAMEQTRDIAIDIQDINTDLSNLLGDPVLDAGGAGAVADEADRAAQEMERQLQAGRDLSREFTEQIALLGTRNEFDKQLLQNQFDYLRNLERIGKAAVPQRDDLTGQAQDLKAAQDLEVLSQAAAEFGRSMGEMAAEALPEVNQELTKTEQLLNSSFQIITNNLTQGIQGLIEGTTTLNDVLSDTLKQLGSLFLNAAFNGLGTALKIPGFADGGRPSVGQVSVVGERGPELFVPDSAGRIYSNSESQQMLDRSRSARAESMERYSAGNSISSSGAFNATVNYNGPTLKFNGDDYIPRSEAPKLVKQGAKMGEDRAMQRLKNSRATRSKLGM